MNLTTEYPQIFLCRCHSCDHQLIFSYDNDDNLFYASVHLDRLLFWHKIRDGIKYIFGKNVEYGHWADFIFNENDVERLQEIVDVLSAGKDYEVEYEHSFPLADKLPELSKSDTVLVSYICSRFEHQVVVINDRQGFIEMCIYMIDSNLFKRIWHGIKYLFGYRCRYGYWDEMIFTRKDADKLQKLVDELKKIKTEKS
jgi:hypothetical protein